MSAPLSYAAMARRATVTAAVSKPQPQQPPPPAAPPAKSQEDKGKLLKGRTVPQPIKTEALEEESPLVDPPVAPAPSVSPVEHSIHNMLRISSGEGAPTGFRDQLWSFLSRNLLRAIDELYTLCEYESNGEQIDLALQTLSAGKMDFEHLRERLGLQKRVEALPRTSPSSSPHWARDSPGFDDVSTLVEPPSTALSRGGVAWDIRKSSSVPTPGAAIVEVMKNLEAAESQRSVAPASPPSEWQNASRKKKKRGGGAAAKAADPPPAAVAPEPETAAPLEASPVAAAAPPPVAAAVSPIAELASQLHSGTAEAAAFAGFGYVPSTLSWADMADIADGISPPIASAVRKEPTSFAVPVVARFTDATALQVPEDGGSDSDDELLDARNISGRGLSIPRTDSDASFPADLPALHGLDMGSDASSGLVSPLSTPPRRSLHDKLSSPDRMKKSPSELKRRTEEKQKSAEVNRDKIMHDKLVKSREVMERLKDVSERQARKVALTETRIRERLERADTAHKAHVEEIRRKAVSENMKVNEVEFIKSIETETKRQVIQQKLDESDVRRKERLAGIVAKQEEKQSKVGEKLQLVRAKEAQELIAKRESIGMKLEFAEARRQEHLRSVASGAVDVRRRSPKPGSPGSPADTYKAAAQTPERDNLRRPPLSDTFVSADSDTGSEIQSLVRLPPASPGRSHTPVDLSSARPPMTEGVAVAASAAAAKKRRSKKAASALAGDPVQFKGELASSTVLKPAPVAFKAHKKSAKALRAAVSALVGEHVWVEEAAEGETAESKEREGDPNPKLLKLIREAAGGASDEGGNLEAVRQLVRLLDPHGITSVPAVSASGLNSLQSLNSFQLAAPRTSHGGFHSADMKLLRTAGALDAVVGMVTRPLIASNPAAATFAMRLVSISCSSPVNRSYLIRTAKSSAIAEALVWALDVLPSDAFVTPETEVTKLASPPSRALPALGKKPKPPLHPTPAVTLPPSDNATCVAAVLQCLWLLLRHVPAPGSQDAPLLSLLRRYVVANSVVERLASCFDRLRGSPHIISYSPLLHMTLAFFEAITADENARLKPVYNALTNPESASLLNSMKVTGIAGLPSLLVSVLWTDCTTAAITPATSPDPKHGALTKSPSDKKRNLSLPSLDSIQVREECLVTTLLITKVLNNVARLNLKLLQDVLGEPSLQMEFHHSLNILLGSISSQLAKADVVVKPEDALGPDSHNECLLAELLLLIGYYCVGNTRNQESLSWGKHPTPLRRLCCLPFRYFSDERRKSQLFPTLIAATVNCATNRTVVQEELSCDMLVGYITSVGEKGIDGDPFSLAARYPTEGLPAALEFLRHP